MLYGAIKLIYSLNMFAIFGYRSYRTHGWCPSTLQYIDGFYSLQISISPPSLTFCFLIARKTEG